VFQELKLSFQVQHELTAFLNLLLVPAPILSPNLISDGMARKAKMIKYVRSGGYF
jgi:hypothetical protein